MANENNGNGGGKFIIPQQNKFLSINNNTQNISAIRQNNLKVDGRFNASFSLKIEGGLININKKSKDDCVDCCCETGGGGKGAGASAPPPSSHEKEGSKMVNQMQSLLPTSFEEIATKAVDAHRSINSLNTAINANSSGASDAFANHNLLNEMIEGYNMPMLETKQHFIDMSRAMQGAGFSGESTRQMFEGVGTAITAAGLNTEKSNKLFDSFNNIAISGKLTLDELQNNLGTILPDSLDIAANAMGMNTEQFREQVKQGNILADDFLPKFAAQMQTNFQGDIPNALNSSMSHVNEFNNKMLEFYNQVYVAAEPFLMVFSRLANVLLPYLSEMVGWVTEKLMGLSAWFKENQIFVYAIAGAFAAWAIVIQAVSIWTSIQALVTNGLTIANNFLSKSIFNSPWGWAIAAVGAFVGVLLYLSDTFGGLENAMNYLWDSTKIVFNNIAGLFKKIFEPISEVVAAWQEGDWGKLATSFAKATISLSPVGLIATTAEYAAEGGFTKGLSENTQKYRDKAEEAKAKNQEWKAANSNSTVSTPQAGGPYTVPGETQPPNGVSSLANQNNTSNTSSNSTARNVMITIQQLVGKLEISTTNLGSSESQVKEAITRLLVSCVRDAEISLSRA